MKINEILIESQQLDEGPFTQAVGKVGGKIAKGVAGVGKDLKTGFKAGYSGEEPPASSEPVAKKPGLLKKIGQAVGDFKAGFKQGSGQASEPSAQTSTSAPATNNPNPVATPAVDAAAEKQSKIGVGQINKIIPTLRTRDLLSLQANLEKAIASKKKAPAASSTNPATGELQAGGSEQGQTTAPADPNANATPPEPGDQRWYNDRVGKWGWKGASGGWQSDQEDIQPKVKSRSKKPVNITGNKQVAQSQKQMASKENLGSVVAESFSIFRKH